MPVEVHKDASEQATSVVPNITSTDLYEFYQAHFSPSNVAHFRGTFVNPAGDTGRPQEAAWDVQEDDYDGLGYYADGVKRTLTDEQIEIFRHSELESRRRDQEKAAERSAITVPDMQDAPSGQTSRAQSSLSPSPSHFKEQQGSKRKRKKRQQEPKPDLRKRTWDVVEQGLDTLEYD